MDLSLGQIMLLALDYTPAGVLPCDGADLRVDMYPSLARLLGNRFGGDGTTTFRVPNLDPRSATNGPGIGYFIAPEGTSPDAGSFSMTSELRVMAAPPSGAAAGDWLLCDGREVPISGNEALFSLVGTMYGGTGIKTFALPKLSAPLAGSGALGYYISRNGHYPSGSCDAVATNTDSSTLEYFVGTLSEFACSNQKAEALCGFGICHGQPVSIPRRTMMFSLLLTRYGGDGRTTFNMPNIPVGTENIQRALVFSGYFPPRAS